MRKALAAVSLCVLAFNIPTALAQKEQLRVGYLPATHDILLFVAQEQEFAKREGIDLEMLQYRNSGEILRALVSEQVDVGIPGIAAPVTYIANGAPLRIIGGAASNSAAIVVAEKFARLFTSKTPAEKLRAFAGMRVGTVRQSTGDSLFRNSLREAGLLSHVDIREFISPIEALTELKSGSIDAAVLWSPYMSLAESAHLPIVLWTYELMPTHEHVCCRQVVRTAYLQQHRAIVVKYLRSLIEAMEFYQDPANEATITAIATRYLPATPADIIKRELFGASPRTTVSVDISENQIKEYVGAMKGSGSLSETQASSAIAAIDPTVIKEAYRSFQISDAEADDCVKNGLLMCPLHRKKVSR